MKKKLIIFDCDGVLVDSEYIACRIFSESLKTYGYSISIEETIRKFTGVNEDDAREIILNESSLDIPENYWVLEQPKLHLAYEKELVPLMLPVLKILDDLKLNRCVASNSSLKHVNNCLKLSKQLHYFSENSIFSSQQVKKAKPAPDLFLFAANKMGFDPKDCLVIEDSRAGADAAIAAGMKVIFFLGGSHARYEWYKNDIENYKKPMMLSCKELLEELYKVITTWK